MRESTLDRLTRLLDEQRQSKAGVAYRAPHLCAAAVNALPALLRIARAAQVMADELLHAAASPKGTGYHGVTAALDELLPAVAALEETPE